MPILEKVQARLYADYLFYCPGCEEHHFFRVGAGEPSWQFNGDMLKPTVTPSIRVRGEGTCHLYIRNGKIQYLSDCTHGLAGQTVPLRPVEYYYDDDSSGNP